jgi:hypothetical protein
MGEQYSPLLAAGALVRKGQGERFACASESQRGEELIKKLQETGKERIRELVRNPLRLSLLCQTSYVLPVDEPLPETKAALYERFTRYFYEWKQEQHPTTRTERRQLNQALGELAKAGLKNCLKSTPALCQFYHCLLWECAQIMPYPDFYQAWHQTTIHQRE